MCQGFSTKRFGMLTNYSRLAQTLGSESGLEGRHG
jgi:hypothetical protein